MRGGRATTAVGLAVAALGLVVALTGVAVAVLAPTPLPGATVGDRVAPVTIGLFAVVALVLLARRPANPLGHLLAAFSLCMGVAGTSSWLGLLLRERAPGSELVDVLAWIAAWAWLPGIGVLAIVFLRFPDGRPASRSWRPAEWVVIVGLVADVALAVLLWPHRQPAMLLEEELWPGAASVAGQVALMTQFPGFVAALVSLVARHRRADVTVRRQLRWLLLAVTLLVVALLLAAVSDLVVELGQGWRDLAGALGLLGVPVAIGVAVLRHRLYDIDRILSRTVTYTVVVTLLGFVYLGGVVTLRAVLAPMAGTSDLAVAGSTLVVATLFGPVVRRVRTAVDRRFDRGRYDADRLVAALAGRLRGAVELDEVVADLERTVVLTLQPSTVGVWLVTSR